MILSDELPKLLSAYEKSLPKNSKDFLITYCNSSTSSFFVGRNALEEENGCFSRAWKKCLTDFHVEDGNKHATITSFLGMIGLDLYRCPELSNGEVIFKINMACEIAKLIGA